MSTFTFDAMGTAVSVRTRQPVPDCVQRSVRAAFEDWEEQFSLWRPDSEASRVADGRLRVADASLRYRRVHDQANAWKVRTNGAFRPVRPDGTEDLSGIVKALGIRAAAAALRESGIGDFALNAGGDVLTAGSEEPDRQWTVGIVDPHDRTQLLSRVETGAMVRAVATSGYAERGDHVWRTDASQTFCQVTVAADDIVTADVLATAILGGGPAALGALEQLYRIDVLAVLTDGGLWASPTFRATAAPGVRW